MRTRMKCSVCLLIFTLVLSCLPVYEANAASTPIAKQVGNANPLIDHHLGADPFALTYNGRVYLYMSVMTMNIKATERLRTIHLQI